MGKEEVKKESLKSRAKTIYKTVHSIRDFRIETVQYFIAPRVHIYDSVVYTQCDSGESFAGRKKVRVGPRHTTSFSAHLQFRSQCLRALDQALWLISRKPTDKRLGDIILNLQFGSCG